MKENIGKWARDKITGFEGTIVIFASHITGCDTYSLQPKCKDGSNEIPESRGFDVGRIEIIDTKTPVTAEQVKDPSGKKVRATSGAWSIKRELFYGYQYRWVRCTY